MHMFGEPLANRHSESLSRLDAAVSAQCVALSNDRDRTRRQTGFHWWPNHKAVLIKRIPYHRAMGRPVQDGRLRCPIGTSRQQRVEPTSPRLRKPKHVRIRWTKQPRQTACGLESHPSALCQQRHAFPVACACSARSRAMAKAPLILSAVLLQSRVMTILLPRTLACPSCA